MDVQPEGKVKYFYFLARTVGLLKQSLVYVSQGSLELAGCM